MPFTSFTITTMAQRAFIFNLLNQGIESPLQIHRHTNIPLCTIKYNKQKWLETGSSNDRPRTGRPKILGPNDHKRIGALLRHHPEWASPQLAVAVAQQGSPAVSARTIRRELNRMERDYSLPLYRPLLTDRHKECRIAFAQAHLHDNWRRTVFTDETTFQLYRNKVKVWSRHGYRSVKHRPKHGPKVHVWGAISWQGTLSIHLFTRNLTADYYIDILTHYLLDQAMATFGGNWRLQQDNDPKHTAKISKAWVGEWVPETFEWPANSPDFNPIEHLWFMLKTRVEKQLPTSLEQLKTYIREEWDKVTPQEVQNLIGSMRSRLEDCISVRGDCTKY